MKKFILVLSCMLCICGLSFAESRDVEVILNKKIKVSYYDELQEFQNVNGVRVYPLSYEGTTYLPIRAISCLFGYDIKWDGDTNSVYLGEGELDTTCANATDDFVEGELEDIAVLLNEDIKIYYNGEEQTFTDVTGKVVYPLSYEGTTYLPVRAISNLFEETIEWDAENYMVVIGEHYSGEEYSGDIEDIGFYDDEEYIDDEDYVDETLDDEEAIIIDESDYYFIDEDGNEVYYYIDEYDNIIYYYIDEDGDIINYYYDDDGDIIYFYDVIEDYNMYL